MPNISEALRKVAVMEVINLDPWVDCHGCQGIICRVDELSSAILGIGDFKKGDLDDWPNIRRSVLDKRAREKLQRNITRGK